MGCTLAMTLVHFDGCRGENMLPLCVTAKGDGFAQHIMCHCEEQAPPTCDVAIRSPETGCRMRKRQSQNDVIPRKASQTPDVGIAPRNDKLKPDRQDNRHQFRFAKVLSLYPRT